MPFPSIRATLLFLIFFSGLIFVSHAQSNSSGSITGVVTAPDGAAVQGAAIKLSGMDAPTRAVSSGAGGTFAIKDLPSGTYALNVISAGFAPFLQQGLTVAVGRTAHVEIRLTLPGVQENVNVTAAQTSFDPSQTSSVVNIDRDRVEELPIPSRNYLTFVLLSPQVAAPNPTLMQQGTVNTSGQFSFGGLRPGSNPVYLDGVNDSDEFNGGSRTQLSPEAISDFQIVNHGFEAQSGGGAGGSIDVQTRTGVNRIHGDAFTFLQNGLLNGTPPLGLYSRKPDENRVRAGVALGGPIQRDKTFYYIAAEQEMARGEELNDVRPSTLATINSAIKQYAPLHSLTLKSGFFTTTDQETELSARLDRNFSASQSAMLRYAFTNTRNVNDAFHTDELTDQTSRGSGFIADNNLNGTLTSSTGTSTLNRFSFEAAQRRADHKTGSTTGPGALIPGVAAFGTPYWGNDRHFETHVEGADTISTQFHNHMLQAGIRLDHVAERTNVPDASQGFFVFANLAALQAGTPDLFLQSFGNFSRNFSESRFAVFAQDHWTSAAHVTLDYGLRYEFNRLPSPLPQDYLNFSPRVGVAWTSRKSLTVRSGFGIFYDRFQLATINRLLEFDGTHAYRRIYEHVGATAVYRQMPVGAAAPSVWRPSPDLRNPYSEVASLSAEQQLPWQTTLSAEYQHVHGVHLGRSANVNLLPPVVLAQASAASLGVTSPIPQQVGNLVFSPARINPAYDAINQFSTSAGSSYNGATLTLNRQFQDDFQLMVGYTYSKTIDDASYDTEQPQNPYALGKERARSLEDQRNRLTLSGLWLLGPDLGDPADVQKNQNPGPLMKVLYGFEFAPIVSVGTGFREDPVVGTDSNREHIYPFAARPTGYARNSLSTPRNIDVDLRVLRMVAIRPGHLDIVAESFNLLNHQNVSLLNTAYGSGLTPQSGFGRPIETSTPRRVQFSLDYEF